MFIAKSENRLFTFEEIRRAKIPYLDAVIEEMLRINAVTVTREAMCNTTILGYPIKKGTQVFFVSNGPGFLSPSIPIDDSKRSETSRAAKLNGTWNESQDLTLFDPERWLVRKNHGEGVWNLTLILMELQGHSLYLAWVLALAGEEDWHT
ncbi:hypothetical protein EYC84_010280 [Monilinia fructicola]|uniref:Cytochrome P450 n=1 Tax=Monilinia fructicola TaxID=38448 RepID=A0A5M9JF11_MONFR|nr:hypothetical protein EYC84_010280 [Monilinia fructicola]